MRIKNIIIGLGVVALTIMSMPAFAGQSKAKAKAGSKVDIMLMEPAQAKTGANNIEVMIKGSDGKPISDADVSVLFVMPKTATMAEMRNEVKLKSAGDGKYTGSGNIGMAGKWNTTVMVMKGGKDIGEKKITLTAK